MKSTNETLNRNSLGCLKRECINQMPIYNFKVKRLKDRRHQEYVNNAITIVKVIDRSQIKHKFYIVLKIYIFIGIIITLNNNLTYIIPLNEFISFN